MKSSFKDAAGRLLRDAGRLLLRLLRALRRLCRRAASGVWQLCLRFYRWISALPLYKRYSEYINYAFFGTLTSLIQFLLYYLLIYAVDMHYVLADNIGFFFSVLASYYTNKKYVYHDETTGAWNEIYKCIMFMGSRLVGQLLETLLLIVFIEWIGVNESIAKFPVLAIVIIANYVTGKLLVFTKEQAAAEQKKPPKE